MIMSRMYNRFQDVKTVLKRFGSNETDAWKVFARFAAGIYHAPVSAITDYLNVCVSAVSVI